MLRLLALGLALSACAAPPPIANSTATSSTAPEALLGTFEDDYGIRYTIGPERWTQGAARYHIAAWNAAERYAVARNDADNPSDGGRWTRIDWVPLDGGDYAWAYCYAVYDAATRAEAVAAPPSGRDTPRTGCGGHPFSRMKRVDG